MTTGKALYGSFGSAVAGIMAAYYTLPEDIDRDAHAIAMIELAARTYGIEIGGTDVGE